MRRVWLFEASFTLSFLYQTNMLMVARRKQSPSVSCAIRLLFSDLTCFRVENVLLHTYVLPKSALYFSAKYFSLGNIFLLINF